MQKYHFTYQDIHRTARDIAERVRASGFDPHIIVAIGSGGPFALAAARALLRRTDLSARDIALEAMAIASEICIYTNSQITVEEL